MLGRIKQTDLSVPSRHRRVLLLLAHRRRKAVSVHVPAQGQHGRRRKRSCSTSTRWPRGTSFSGSAPTSVSDDGNWLAYSTDTTGYRQYTLRVKDLRTGQLLPENIERVGSVVWATDNKTLFYTTEDAVSKRSDKFWRHVVGRDGERPGLRGEGRALRRRRRAIARRRSHLPRVYAKTSTRSCATCRPTTPNGDVPTSILPREAEHEYDVDHYNGLFYITHQQGRQELPGRDRADGRSVREELDSRSSTTIRRSRSTACRSSPITRGVRTRRRA